ncbi:hypothetical protein NDU88_004953 [Pleurodeles waltl]|uniref:Secreted protein n=1 Tax=Pleurodeles waltl TaxID=8319 RepID=A0AAV7TSQ2_PLEWA|nr:hypothetical protein NDU88_004953 [Pleurodeles waltl]
MAAPHPLVWQLFWPIAALHLAAPRAFSCPTKASPTTGSKTGCQTKGARSPALACGHPKVHHRSSICRLGATYEEASTPNSRHTARNRLPPCSHAARSPGRPADMVLIRTLRLQIWGRSVTTHSEHRTMILGKGAPIPLGVPGSMQDAAGKWELTRSASRCPFCMATPPPGEQ